MQNYETEYLLERARINEVLDASRFADDVLSAQLAKVHQIPAPDFAPQYPSLQTITSVETAKAELIDIDVARQNIDAVQSRPQTFEAMIMDANDRLQDAA